MSELTGQKITHENYRRLQGQVVSRYLERRKKHPGAFKSSQEQAAVNEVTAVGRQLRLPAPGIFENETEEEDV